jgi:hemoglobin
MNTTHLFRSLVLGLSIGLCAAASHAQTAPVADDTLFQAFGGQRGLVVLMDDFMTRLLADKRMNPFFKDTDQKHIKEQLVVQFCQVSGGPCKLAKPDMKKPHSGVDIAMADFNALVEVLQQSMDAQGIPFGVQNRLLAKLAPMHRDIVNVP